MKPVYYRLHLKDGRTFDFLDYQYLKAWWMTHAKQGLLHVVEVLDVPDPD
ncbi:hypothetical protein [Synechococcus phage S-N03]|uniref:DUF7441 domain-containing protein n=1 Tax=Synechococcus phage S-N03 TaxID=2718943 RepID=A0A6G8R6R6_9CAUD|nr:hypothetical protein PQC09_gp219 [Synechococcus phage S-N03]QIN96848.1 hypothetical protein [Synechococcus phage S-N03]